MGDSEKNVGSVVREAKEGLLKRGREGLREGESVSFQGLAVKPWE